MNENNPKKTTNYQYFLFFISFISGSIGGLTSTIVPSYLPTLIKEFTTENVEGVGAIVNAVFIYGMLFGGILLGLISDKWGRKMSFLIAVFCIGVFMLLSAFVNTWMWLVFFRFMTGFGVGGVLLITAVIISEEWNEETKSIALGILSISFPVGIFSAGIITYNVSNWRSAFFAGILPLIIGFLIYFFMKESRKWLEDKIPYKIKSSVINDREMLRVILSGSLIYGSMLIGLWAVFAWLPTWVQTIVVDSDGQQERGISMMIFASGGLLGGFLSGWICNYFGIKRVMLWCFAGAFLISLILFKFTTSLTAFTYCCMAIIALCFGVSQGVLNVYIPDLFPTQLRATATGICFNISRLFTATVVFFVGWLVQSLNGYGNALFYFSFIFLIGFIIVFFQKEKEVTQL
ncbi:MAG: MFS transporter [Saprospiraceae bacterium]